MGVQVADIVSKVSTHVHVSLAVSLKTACGNGRLCPTNHHGRLIVHGCFSMMLSRSEVSCLADESVVQKALQDIVKGQEVMAQLLSTLEPAITVMANDLKDEKP